MAVRAASAAGSRASPRRSCRTWFVVTPHHRRPAAWRHGEPGRAHPGGGGALLRRVVLVAPDPEGLGVTGVGEVRHQAVPFVVEVVAVVHPDARVVGDED